MVLKAAVKRACSRQSYKKPTGEPTIILYIPSQHSYRFSRIPSCRKALIIDCGELQKASSDTALLAGLAQQTGYWPVFTFLNSMNNLIDLASVGLIGQKGISVS